MYADKLAIAVLGEHGRGQDWQLSDTHEVYKKKSSEATLINNWGFVFITKSEQSWGEVKAGSPCYVVCLITEDKGQLPHGLERKQHSPNMLWV